MNINTYKNRRLPIYVAAVLPKSAYYIGQQGRNLMAVPFNRFGCEPNAPELFLQNYHEGLAACPSNTSDNQLITNFFCHVAESDEQARDNIASAFGRYVLSRAKKLRNQYAF